MVVDQLPVPIFLHKNVRGDQRILADRFFADDVRSASKDGCRRISAHDFGGIGVAEDRKPALHHGFAANQRAPAWVNTRDLLSLRPN